jgi:hypothetical protein
MVWSGIPLRQTIKGVRLARLWTLGFGKATKYWWLYILPELQETKQATDEVYLTWITTVLTPVLAAGLELL